MPLRAGTDAVIPVSPVVTMLGAVIGGGWGEGVTVTVAVAGLLAVPAALISTQESCTDGGAPAV